MRKVRLSEVADLTVGYVGTMAKHYVDEGVPFIRSMNVEPFRINYNDLKYIPVEFNDKLAKSKLHKGDVVIVRTGKPGACAVIPGDYEEINCSDLVIVRPYLDELDPLYVACYINYSYRTVNARLVGAVQQHFNVKVAGNLEIELPSLERQRQIAGIIDVLNKKIQVNEIINENLQEQAKAIFAKMIIEDADESWTQGVLSDISVITMGQSPKGDTYNEDGNGTVFFQGRAEFGFRFPTRRLSTTEPKRMAHINDALMSVRAPVGDMNVAYEDCCIGRGLAAIHSKDGHQSFVLYTMFNLREELNVFNGEGTVFGSINRDALNSMSISIPPKRVMDKFEAVVAPIDAAIRNNYDENYRLEAIQDSLLPRLMSGELDVSELDF